MHRWLCIAIVLLVLVNISHQLDSSVLNVDNINQILQLNDLLISSDENSINNGNYVHGHNSNEKTRWVHERTQFYRQIDDIVLTKMIGNLTLNNQEISDQNQVYVRLKIVKAKIYMKLNYICKEYKNEFKENTQKWVLNLNILFNQSLYKFIKSKSINNPCFLDLFNMINQNSNQTNDEIVVDYSKDRDNYSIKHSTNNYDNNYLQFYDASSNLISDKQDKIIATLNTSLIPNYSNITWVGLDSGISYIIGGRKKIINNNYNNSNLDIELENDDWNGISFLNRPLSINNTNVVISYMFKPSLYYNKKINPNYDIDALNYKELYGRIGHTSHLIFNNTVILTLFGKNNSTCIKNKPILFNINTKHFLDINYNNNNNEDTNNEDTNNEDTNKNILPSLRSNHISIYYPKSNCLFLFGGKIFNNNQDENNQLELDDPHSIFKLDLDNWKWSLIYNHKENQVNYINNKQDDNNIIQNNNKNLFLKINSMGVKYLSSIRIKNYLIFCFGISQPNNIKNNNNGYKHKYECSNDCMIFDFIKNKWYNTYTFKDFSNNSNNNKFKNLVPEPRYGASLTVMNEDSCNFNDCSILLFGGQNSNGTYLNDIWSVNIVAVNKNTVNGQIKENEEEDFIFYMKWQKIDIYSNELNYNNKNEIIVPEPRSFHVSISYKKYLAIYGGENINNNFNLRYNNQTLFFFKKGAWSNGIISKMSLINQNNSTYKDSSNNNVNKKNNIDYESDVNSLIVNEKMTFITKVLIVISVVIGLLLILLIAIITLNKENKNLNLNRKRNLIIDEDENYSNNNNDNDNSNYNNNYGNENNLQQNLIEKDIIGGGIEIHIEINEIEESEIYTKKQKLDSSKGIKKCQSKDYYDYYNNSKDYLEVEEEEEEEDYDYYNDYNNSDNPLLRYNTESINSNLTDENKKEISNLNANDYNFTLWMND